MIVSGSFDLLVEVVCEDDDHLSRCSTTRCAPSPECAAPRPSPICASTSRPTPGEPADGHRPHTGGAQRRAGTCGCTSRGSARTATTARCRSSPAARAATCGTRTASATSTALSGLVHRAGRPRPPRARRGRPPAGRDTLEYFPIWTYAHPPAIELAARLAELAPGDLNRVFFTSGGSEAVESAWKLARQYFRAIGQGQRHKVIARETAYHGTTLGALAITGVPRCAPFEPLTPGAVHVANTNRYRHPLGDDEKAFMLAVTDAIEDAILFEGPETVAAVFLEPVQNAGGCFVPPEGYFAARARDLRPVRRAPRLRRGDLRVRPARRHVRLRALRLPARHDHLREGPHERLLTARRRDLQRRIAEPFLAPGSSFLHGITFGGHPVSCAGRPGQPRRLRARGPARARGRACARVPRAHRRARATSRSSATCAAPATSSRSSSYRTSQTPSSTTRGGGAAARLPLTPPVRRGPDLPRRRPGRPGRPALAAAHRRRRRVRRASSRSCVPRSPRRGRSSAHDRPLTVGVPREVKEGEHRVAVTPDGVHELAHHGVSVLIEGGAGLGSSITDDDYAAPAPRSSTAPTTSGSAPTS